MNKKIFKHLDYIYYWLSYRIKDDDTIFGSKQLFLFVLTIIMYMVIGIGLFLRLFENNQQSIFWDFAKIGIIISYYLFLKYFFRRYSRNCMNYNFFEKKPMVITEVILILIILFPYILIYTLFFD
jgi:hypothetical protein